MKLSKAAVHSLNLLTIFIKNSILDVWNGPGSAVAAGRQIYC